MATAVGAACYFCLEDEEEGMPLVRDCSYRGNSGYAHFSCLAKYAEQKSKRADDGDVIAFSEPWEICNNCKQSFQNQPSIDLASSCVSFAEETYDNEGSGIWDKLKVIVALRFKMMANMESMISINGNINPKVDKVESTILDIRNLLSMIDRTKKNLNMSRWIHMPQDSEEYQFYNLLCGEYEAYAYEKLGLLSMDKDLKIASSHLKKARAIYNLVGMKDFAKLLDVYIAGATEKDENARKETPFLESYTSEEETSTVCLA